MQKKRGDIVGRWREKIESEPKATFSPKYKSFHPVEAVSMAEGMKDIIAGRWRGIGLLDVLDGQTHIWGKQILIAESGIDRHRLRAAYPGTMIFTPAEFLDVVEGWPESEGLIRAKRAFLGHIAGGAA